MPIKNIVTDQKVTKEKQERARELRREMTPTTLSAFGTSPKYDDVNFKSAFRLFLVVFGGGRVGAGMLML